MAGRILKDDIDELRRRVDIVAVVGDYTTLKRAGRSYKGLCPFHDERTPSFHVTPDNAFFHCFGCDASGDIYDFLRRIEGLDFPEAVEQLARRTGFTLRYESLSVGERRSIGARSRLLEAMRAAHQAFLRKLYEPAGEVARGYLKERGFGRADAEAFELGFAPEGWDEVSLALTREGIPAEDLLRVGLSARNDRGGLRDRFRGRLMFPIHDPGGDVIGFGGRVLPGIDYGGFEPPKYLNSPETPLYKKHRVLYGVLQARAEIVRRQQVVVCEGYTDVMGLHHAGFPNAVATCGTAVGVEHLRLIARYAPRVVLAFDADDAGVKAAERAFEAARELALGDGGARLDLRVLPLEDGKDPAELAAELGADGVHRAVDEATPVVPFLIRHRLARAELSSESGRASALRSALEVLALEPDPDLRREWARTEVADGVGTSYDFVAATARRQGVDLDVHEGVAVLEEVRDPSRSAAGSRVKLERDVLRVAIQHPFLLPEEWFELEEGDFHHETAIAIHRAVSAAGGAGVDLAEILAAARDDGVRARIRRLALEPDPEVEDDEVAPDVVAGRVRRLLADRLEAEERDLRRELARLNHVTDREALVTMQRRLQALQQRRRELTTVGD